jgi:hypothetical protein
VAVDGSHVVRVGQKGGGDWLPGVVFEWAYLARQQSASEVAAWHDQSRLGHPQTLRWFARREHLFDAGASPPPPPPSHLLLLGVG